MANQVKQKAGRKYSVDSSGITTLKKDFIVIQDSIMSADGEIVSFPGVPAINSAHPSYPGLFVQYYEVQEGEGKDKNVLTVTVNYGPQTTETSGSGQDAVTCVVDEWGWDDGTDEKELVTGVDGTPVRNSAGDPFESVPKVMAPAPVFTKVMKFKTMQSGWASSNCKVNSSAITVGGIECPIGSLLCTVGMKRIIGSKDWKYLYTVHLRLKSNKVKIAGANQLTDIGWDVAVVDAGMRELDSNGEKKLIRVVDKETGKLCTVASAALLNGHGAKLDDEDEPYNFRVQAYERASFPSWFYSEPTLVEEGLT